MHDWLIDLYQSCGCPRRMLLSVKLSSVQPLD